MKQKRQGLFVISAIGLAMVPGLVFFLWSPVGEPGTSVISGEPAQKQAGQEGAEPPSVPKRLSPETVRAVYVTMHTAGRAARMKELLALARDTEVNAMVVDVKGSQGELAFDMFDVPALVERLHAEGVYAIARVVVFQDSSVAERDPGAAIQKRGGGIWRDRRGFAWVDPASESGGDYVIEISKRALDAGFDEVNYDYIRFPTDGNLDIIAYPVWNEGTPRNEVIAAFARKASAELKRHAPDMKLSIDIFGYTFLRSDDLGIGQRLVDLAEPFDYICPMVYPSHYKTGNFGFENPAEHPYEVVRGTLEQGLAQFGEKAPEYAPKIRPWLQAFDLGAVYTPEKMTAQMQATADALSEKGNGWLLWDPGNEYERGREYLAPAATE